MPDNGSKTHSGAFRFAKILSMVFVPPMVIFLSYLYMTFALGVFSTGLLYIPLLFGLVLPIGMFIYLRKKGMVSDNEALLKEERFYPYIIGVIILIAGVLLLRSQDVTGTAMQFWISYLVCCILIIPITKFWKISAHSLGTAIPGALIFRHDYSLFIVVFMVSCLVFWSRHYLKCHTVPQIIGGYTLGFVVSLIILDM